MFGGANSAAERPECSLQFEQHTEQNTERHSVFPDSLRPEYGLERVSESMAKISVTNAKPLQQLNSHQQEQQPTVRLFKGVQVQQPNIPASRFVRINNVTNENVVPLHFVEPLRANSLHLDSYRSMDKDAATQILRSLKSQIETDPSYRETIYVGLLQAAANGELVMERGIWRETRTGSKLCSAELEKFATVVGYRTSSPEGKQIEVRDLDLGFGTVDDLLPPRDVEEAMARLEQFAVDAISSGEIPVEDLMGIGVNNLPLDMAKALLLQGKLREGVALLESIPAGVEVAGAILSAIDEDERISTGSGAIAALANDADVEQVVNSVLAWVSIDADRSMNVQQYGVDLSVSTPGTALRALSQLLAAERYTGDQTQIRDILGMVFHAQGSPLEASAAFEGALEALRAQPVGPEPWDQWWRAVREASLLNRQGASLANAGRHSEAIVLYKECLHFFNRNTKSILNMAISYRSQGELDRAFGCKLAVLADPEANVSRWTDCDHSMSFQSTRVRNDEGIRRGLAERNSALIKEALVRLEIDPTQS